MPRRALKYLLLTAPLAALCGVRCSSPRPLAPPASGVQVVGPSAMLAMQRAGQVLFDARPGGRAIPRASRRFPARICAPPLIVSPDQSAAERWARSRGWSGLVRWVPAPLLEVRARAGVAQMSPRETWRKAAQGEAVIVDVSEAGEWDALRLPGSIRVDWARIIAGDRSWVPRDKAIVFT